MSEEEEESEEEELIMLLLFLVTLKREMGGTAGRSLMRRVIKMREASEESVRNT